MLQKLFLLGKVNVILNNKWSILRKLENSRTPILHKFVPFGGTTPSSPDWVMNQVTALHFQFSHHKTHHLAQWPLFWFWTNSYMSLHARLHHIRKLVAETQNFRISFGYIGQNVGKKIRSTSIRSFPASNHVAFKTLFFRV